MQVKENLKVRVDINIKKKDKDIKAKNTDKLTENYDCPQYPLSKSTLTTPSFSITGLCLFVQEAQRCSQSTKDLRYSRKKLKEK